MNANASRADMSWADVQTYSELLSGRGDVSALASFTQMASIGQSSRSTIAEEASGQRMANLLSPIEDLSQGPSNFEQFHDFHSPQTPHPQYASRQGGCIEAGGPSGSLDPVECVTPLT